MTRGRMPRLLSGVVGLALVTAIAVTPSAAFTDAAWTDHEHAAADVQAIVVPTPVTGASPVCQAQTVLVLGARLTIHWRVPPGFDGYGSADAQYGQVVGGLLDPILGSLLGSITTTGTPGAYTTVVGGGLLSGLTGASKRFGIRLTHESGWVSDWLVADANFPALVGTGTCVMSVVES